MVTAKRPCFAFLTREGRNDDGKEPVGKKREIISGGNPANHYKQKKTNDSEESPIIESSNGIIA